MKQDAQRIPDSMRASMLVDVGQLELRSIPCPAPKPKEVLVEVRAVGLCGTDFHIFGGEFNFNLDARGLPIPLAREPQVLGHEITGTVRAIGNAVDDLQPGDRVVLDQGLNCKSAHRAPLCEYCSSGDSHQCEHYIEHGITGLQGGFAEYLALPAVNAVRLESDLPFDQAALTEPLGCVLHSTDFALRAHTRYRFGATGDKRVRTALILGAGPAGLLFLQVLRNVVGFDGAILVCDRNPHKRELVRALGGVALAPENLIDQVLEHTAGRRVEYLVEATGSGAVFEELPALFRKQATVLLYGVGHGGASLETLNQVQWKEPTLVASVGASGGFDADGRPTIYRRALQLIEQGAVRVDSLVSHRYEGLEALPQAFTGEHDASSYVKGVALLGAD